MLLQLATRVHDVRHEREGSIRVVMKDRWRMSSGMRRTSAVVAIAALAIGGAKIASDHTMPGSGFSTVATVAADPTGPTGGGMTGPPGGGSQFQPPGLPPQMPDYQGGINQPPLDQNNGVSIYNTGSPGHNRFPASKQVSSPSRAGINPHTAHRSRTTRPIPDTPRDRASRTRITKHRSKATRRSSPSKASSPNRVNSSRVRPRRRLSSPAKTISRISRTAS
ncbi:Uncharacterised protein [Mycobacteroides abscessus subsp. bolletii]|nr:Uncharacterised protein [Mycobacteroides abscessus subsp. bolletii]SKP64143.1 Uncharacterised protein [Mycobacteroides abscessus subsp. bolletii]SKP72029.1 Uncharacterised protein [Mycobacteroides abscessus subsp. bolletii]SKQ24797.1 Uncharacterised protein [Mycobacteroides abscessus subsp. bolletii]